ncbi:MAG: 50S ribosomal protein L11 methyltransferase [Pseudomonadota bacterium]
MPWQQLTVTLGELSPAATEEALLHAGALAITYTDAADQPILEPGPGETPLWTDARLTALFDEAVPFESIALSLLSGLELRTLPDLDVQLLPDREWEREWLDRFQPMAFGERLWVCPKHLEVDADDAVVVQLDPGLAFGTGTHATTALCLQQLDRLAGGLGRVLDFGCGSGVLAIAAIKLGATRATAVDIDTQAITATRNNARDNGVSEIITVGEVALAEQQAPYDVVLANILAAPLVELAPSLCQQLVAGGQVILSGILAAQAATVQAAYAPWIEFRPTARQDGWVMLAGTRKDGI